MKEVVLSEYEMLMVKNVGLWRQHANISAKVKETKKDTLRSGDEIHADGFMAEYAFAKWKNLFVDLSTEMRSGGSDLKDENFRFDIKSTRHKDPYLRSGMKVNPDVDVYVLAQIVGNKVLFIGWAYKDELIRPENIKDYGTGAFYMLKQDQLRPL